MREMQSIVIDIGALFNMTPESLIPEPDADYSGGEDGEQAEEEEGVDGQRVTAHSQLSSRNNFCRAESQGLDRVGSENDSKQDYEQTEEEEDDAQQATAKDSKVSIFRQISNAATAVLGRKSGQ